jgi:hypothetical protein
VSVLSRLPVLRTYARLKPGTAQLAETKQQIRPLRDEVKAQSTASSTQDCSRGRR